MLRIIVISLVVANLLLLGFQSSQPTTPPETRPAAPEVRDSGVPTIHLFSEMMQDEGLLAGNRRCFTLGPFHSPDDRDDVNERLTVVTTRVSERQTEALVEKGYWVYMPPYASLLEANEALLKLQALGLKDVAIIYDGEWKNSISLGYFMRQENAQRRKKALEDRGYSPRMRIQRQAEPRYWLDYEQQPGAGLIALDMRNRPNDFMQRPVPCPETEFPETELSDAESLAAGDRGGNPDAPPAPSETAEPVSAGDEAPDETAETGQTTRQPDQAKKSAQDAEAQPGAGQPAETAAGEQAGSQTTEEPEVQEDGSGVTAADPDTPVGSDDTAEPRSAEITSPKQVVGTGPAHTVAAEPAPSETTADQGNETPAAVEPGIAPDSGEEKPADDGKADGAGAPAGDATGQSGGEEAEKDSGDGSGQRR